MKLHLFPQIAKAFAMILADQPYPSFMKVRIVDVSVPKEWVLKFETADSILFRARGKTIKDCKIAKGLIASELKHGDVRLEDDAFEALVLPVNDVHFAIMKALGATPSQIRIVNEVLEGFFDG